MTYLRIIILACALLPAAVAFGDDSGPPPPSAKDKCPVCGMFVAKYPDFLAAIRFSDGAWVYFDGTKDMFKYLFDIRKYHPSRAQADISAIYVTDYYDLSAIDAQAAAYVAGSDVYGPMGRELIPFAKEEDARGFMKDHQGKSLVRYEQVTLPLVKGLD